MTTKVETMERGGIAVGGAEADVRAAKGTKPQTGQRDASPAPAWLDVTTSEDATGLEAASCDWQGQSYRATSRNGAILALCRVLVPAGCPDLPWRTPRGLSGRVHRAARLTVAGGEQQLRFVAWKPGPKDRRMT